MMEEEQFRTSSPPLSSKGYYNMDFDAIDDNLSPFPAKTDMDNLDNSPSLIGRDHENNLEPKREALPTRTEGVQDDNRSHNQQESTPKNRKPKLSSSSKSSSSSRQISVPIQDDNSKDATDAQKVDGPGESQNEAMEKPVKHRKSGLKKPRSVRPMSMSYDEQVHKAVEETPVRASSPPLPGRGYYKLDLDALDGSLSPLPTKKENKNSPLLTRRDPDNTQESSKEGCLGKAEGITEDSRSHSEQETTPKKRKPKSSSSSSSSSSSAKQSSALLQSKDSQDCGNDLGADGSAAPQLGGDDKLVKPRKSGKKTRSAGPASASCEEQRTPEKRHQPEDAAALSVDPKEAAPQQPSTNIPSQAQESQPTQEHPPAGIPTLPSQKNPPAPAPAQPDPAPGPETSAKMSEDPSALMARSMSALEKSPPLPKKHRSRSASVTSEDASEMRPKKDKSSGKVRKSKSKKSSSSSRRDPMESSVDGEAELLDKGAGDASDRSKERKRSRKPSSQGDRVGREPREPSAAADGAGGGGSGVNSAEPAGPCKEAERSPNGESGMTSSHSRDSIIKLVQVLKYSQSDWNKLRQELEVQQQAQLRANDGDWSAKLAEREAHVAALEEQIRKLKLTNDDMRVVMGEFEKTIGQLQSEKEKTKNATQQSLRDITKEKDQAVEDLRSVETAFSDLHRRYEKTKAVLEGFKQNEDVLKKCVQDLQNKVKKAEQKTQMVRVQAEDKLDRATEELEKVKKANASEIARLEAAVRKAHIHVESIESALEQKVKENKELTAICDELIAKVQ